MLGTKGAAVCVGVAVAMAFTFAACGGGGGGGGSALVVGTTVTSLQLVSGNQQTGVAGDALAAPLVVEARDSSGNVVANASVTFSVTSGGGSVSPATPKTDSSGRAQTTWTLGASAGANGVTASANGGTVTTTFSATGTTGPGTQLVPGTTTVTATAGSSTSVTVVLKDRNGNPVAGASVSFAIASGPGGLTGSAVTTDARGQASTSFQSTGAGSSSIVATSGGASVTIPVTTGSGSPVKLAFASTVASAPVQALLPSFSVAVQDSFGNTVSTSGTSIGLTIATNPGAAIFSGTTMVATQNGVAAFSTVALSALGQGYVIQASATGLTNALSNAFNVEAFSATDGIGHLDVNAMIYTRGLENDGANGTAFSVPAGFAIDATGHRLFVSDQGNNRVVAYDLDAANTLAGQSHLASIVLGQTALGQNGAGKSAAQLSGPSQLAFDATNRRLFVADSDNNRVVVYDVTSPSSGMNATYVLGQAAFGTNGAGTTASTMNGPSGVAYDATNARLFVVDSKNNRVLVFDLSGGITSGMSASYVLGQTTFTGNGTGTTADTLNEPRAAAYFPGKDRLFVSDKQNHRVLIWDFTLTALNANGLSASNVFGQSNFTSNGSATSQSGFNGPRGVAVDVTTNRLAVADDSNSRILIWDLPATGALTDGANAANVLGQTTFTSGTAQGAATGGINNPEAVFFDGAGKLYVADRFNRMVVHDLAGLTDGQLPSDGIGHTDLGVMNYTRTGGNDGPNPQAFRLPRAIALDATHHRLFVADESNHRVLVFALSNQNDFTGKNRSASFVLGQPDFATRTSAVNSTRLQEPTGVAYDATTDRLFVADTGHYRVLVFDVSTITNGMAADHVLGQSTFTATGPNNPSTATGVGFLSQIALDASAQRLYVADKNDNRVLVFDVTSATLTNGQAPLFVLGQATTGTTASATTSTGLNAPYACAVGNGRLFVSESGNNRVVAYDLPITANGVAATLVLGQSSFVTKGTGSSASELNAPLGLEVDTVGQRLFVADMFNNRVLVFRTAGITSGANAASVIGQSSFANTSTATTQTGLNAPYGVQWDASAKRLFVVEYGNNRVLLFQPTLP